MTRNVAVVGNGVDPETMKIDYYKLNNHVRIWDTPGLGDGVALNKQHKKKIKKLLNECILPHIDPDRVLVIINQADVAMKGCHWDTYNKRPDPVLQKFLDEMAYPIQYRIRETTGITIPLPVCCSTTKGRNITGVIDLILDHLPKRTRD